MEDVPDLSPIRRQEVCVVPSPIFAVVAGEHRSISLLRPRSWVDRVSSDVVKEAEGVFDGQLKDWSALTRLEATSLTACSTAEAG